MVVIQKTGRVRVWTAVEVCKVVLLVGRSLVTYESYAEHEGTVTGKRFMVENEFQSLIHALLLSLSLLSLLKYSREMRFRCALILESIDWSFFGVVGWIFIAVTAFFAKRHPEHPFDWHLVVSLKSLILHDFDSVPE